MSFFKAFYYGLINLVFPAQCPLCGSSIAPASKDIICDGCWRGFRRVEQPFCPKCGRPIESGTVVPYALLCGDCRISRKRFGICRSAGLYEGTLRECLHLFKYEARQELAVPLGRFMAECALREFREIAIDEIVPVPLHRGRRRARGFNQSQLLAVEIGQHMGISVAPKTLRKIRSCESQSTLKRADRLKNVRGTYALHRKNAVEGRHLLLIDDVFTTGATARECVKVLLRGGARRVDILTAARGV